MNQTYCTNRDVRKIAAAKLLIVLMLPLVAGMEMGIFGIVEGTVTDRNTGEPLPGATVAVVGTTLGATTDGTGKYRISMVRAGSYDLRVSFIGYRPTLIQGVNVLADLRTTADAKLEQSSVELPAVEVRAVQPLIQRDLAGTAFNVNAKKMELLPVSNIQELVALQPGTTIEGNMRGGKTTEVMYLVDGLPIMDVLGGGSSASLPRSAINGVALQTGGFDAEYGNAQSGIVNVVTRPAATEWRYMFRKEADQWLPERIARQTNRLSEVEFSATGPIIRDELLFFTANTFQTQDTRWWQDFDRQMETPVVIELNGLTKVEFLTGAASKWTAQGLYSIRKWRDYEFSWRFNLNGLPARSREAYRGTVGHSFSPVSGLYLNILGSAYYQRSRIGEGSKNNLVLTSYEYDFFLRYVVGGKRLWWSDAKQFIATGKIEASYDAIPQHLLKVGIEFNQYDVSSELLKYEPQKTYFGKPIANAPLLNYSNAYSYRPRTGSVYIQDKIQVAMEGSILTFGLRWDWLDPLVQRPLVEFIPVSQGEYNQVVTGTKRASFKDQISPRFSYAVPFGEASFLFVNYGQYFQFPLFDYLYSGIRPEHLFSGAKNVQAGNPDLEPERTLAWEIGFKYGFNANVVGSATYFRKRMLNQVDTKTLIPFDSKSAGDFGFASYVNNAEANVEGIEFVLSREQDEKIRGSISYSYMVTEGISEYVDQSINFAQWGFPLVAHPFPLSWDQRHTIKADGEFLAFELVRTNVVLAYNSARPYTYFPTRDGFVPLNPDLQFLPNNARMRSALFVHVKSSADIPVGDLIFTLYASAQNVLNAKNVRWMDSSGRIGGELEDPGAYYDPRRVRIGLEVRL